MKRCPECGEPPHYHSFCTLCAQLFWRSQWKYMDSRQRALAFRQAYLEKGSVRLAAEALGVNLRSAYEWRIRLKLPKFPPDGNRRTTWLEEHDSQLAAAIADGLTLRETAFRLARTPLAVSLRRGVLRLPKFKSPPSWRKGKRHPLADKVTACRRAGLSYRQVAARVGTTRNGVAGIVRDYIRRAEVRP